MKYFLLLSLIVAGFTQANEDLKPFASDGCSLFPDGTLQHQELWLSCCKKHDFAYWQGGTYQQRFNADQELKQCVEKIGEPSIAAIMLAGVRVGGSPYLPNTFRWGYGWPYLRGYKAITPEEQIKIDALMNTSN